jgi:DNA-binding protein HU-beta
MLKKDLVDFVVEYEQMNPKQVEGIVDILFQEMGRALEKGEEVRISNFGTFKPTERAARSGFNPKTKEKIEIPAKKTVTFKIAKALKEKLN